MSRFFKIFPSLSQNWLKFKKVLEKSGDFAQNLAQTWSDWYMNGLLFLEKLVFVWVYFKILWRHVPTKTKLEYLPRVIPLSIDIEYNKRLDRQRPCLEGDFNGGSNNIVQSNKSV